MPAEELQISGLNPISALTTGCQIGTDDASNVTYKFTLTQLNTFLENYFLLQANNLDDLPSISTAVTNLGLTIGTNTQAYSSVLTSIAGASIVDSAVLVTSAGGSPMFSTTLPAGTGLPGYLPLTGGTMTGSLNLGSQTLTGLTAPVNASDAATKAYADNIAAGFNPIQAVYSASTANLTGYTYNNGTAGVGATLTAPSNGVFTGDGLTPPVGSRYLYKNDTTGAGVYNGIYTLTTSTSGSPAVLTRATDYNTANDIQPGDLISVEAGTVNIGSSWYQTATIVAVGTTAVAFSQFFSPTSYVSSMLSSGTIYIGNGSNVATQSNSTWPASTTINQILYSSASNTVSGITAANNGVLISGSSGVPAWLGSANSAVMTTNSSGVPAWTSQAVFRAHSTASMSPGNGTPALFALATVDFDTISSFNNTASGNGYSYKPTVAGYYRFNASFAFVFSGNGTATIYLYKNGAAVANFTFPNNTSAAQGGVATVSDIIQCNGSTDYVQVFLGFNNQSNATTCTSVNCFFEGNILV